MKMRKTITIIALLLILLPAGQAQSINAFVAAGTALSQVEGDELKGFDHWGLAGSVGAFINLDQRDMWGASIEAGYSCRGIYNIKFNSKNYYNIILNLHYADIPVTVFFKDPFGGLRIGVGLVYSRLIAQPGGSIAFNPDYFIPDTSNMKFLKNDFAAAAEMRIKIWKGLQFSLRYQYSLLPVKKDVTFRTKDREWKNNYYNSAVQVRLLWQFGYNDRPSYAKNRRHRRR